MPVDFWALPARVTVPDERQALVPWLIGLVVVVAAGAAISIALWPAGRPTQTSWFWLRAFLLPFIVWFVAYGSSRFLHAHRKCNVQADNAAVDRKEQHLHDDAGVPLAVIGQSWCFSGAANRNSLEDAMKAREPVDTVALVGPDKPFFRGSTADEKRRHAALLEWLLVELITPFATNLKEARNVEVSLCLDSLLTADTARSVISRAWTRLGLKHASSVQLPGSMSLYAIDGWLDRRTGRAGHLVIAVQLRSAISGGLPPGKAEAGVAVLLTGALDESGEPIAAVRAHRPTGSTAGSLEKGIAHALQWANCAAHAVETLWDAGLDEPLATAFRSLEGSVHNAPSIELARTIGDAGIAAPWLALAFSAARTQENAGAQLILDQDDGDLVAMICRKKI
jgi:hypothetical protein